MKYLTIIKAGLGRKKVSTSLTILSIAVAFLLFSLGRSVAVAFNSEVEFAGNDRLVVVSSLSFTQALPMSHKNRIEAIEGVDKVVWRQWFGGTYKERQNFFPKWPVPDNYFDVYPEWEISEDQRRAFSTNLMGMVAGADLVEKFGWKIGDRIPIIPDIWPKADGTVWEFDLVGIISDPSGNETGEAFMRWKYFDEARAFENGLVGNFIVRIDDPSRADFIAKEIDSLFANSSDETKTSTEEAFSRMFAEQYGNIGLIINSVLAASFFTILLLTANTMSQAVRERTSELGVLKSIGYSDYLIMFFVLLESVLLCFFGALIGLIVAYSMFPGFSELAGGYAGELNFPISIVISAFVLAFITACLSGLMPAYSAMRLNVVDALRKH